MVRRASLRKYQKEISILRQAWIQQFSFVENISKDNFKEVTEEKFFEIVRTGFSSKRKLLAGNLANKYGKDVVAHAFSAVGIEPKARAETVHLNEWLKLSKTLGARSKPHLKN